MKECLEIISFLTLREILCHGGRICGINKQLGRMLFNICRDFSIFIGMWGLRLVKENNKVLKFCSMINFVSVNVNILRSVVCFVFTVNDNVDS